MDDTSLALMGVTANTIRAIVHPRRELDGIDIAVNPAKTATLTPKGHAQTAEDISLLESVDVGIAEEGEVTVVSVPIVKNEYVLERTMVVVKDVRADRLALYLANIPNKQTAVLIVIEYLEQRTTNLEKALDTGLSLEAYRRSP